MHVAKKNAAKLAAFDTRLTANTTTSTTPAAVSTPGSDEVGDMYPASRSSTKRRRASASASAVILSFIDALIQVTAPSNGRLLMMMKKTNATWFDGDAGTANSVTSTMTLAAVSKPDFVRLKLL